MTLAADIVTELLARPACAAREGAALDAFAEGLDAAITPYAGPGEVTSEGASVAGHIVVFDDESGDVIADSGVPVTAISDAQAAADAAQADADTANAAIAALPPMAFALVLVPIGVIVSLGFAQVDVTITAHFGTVAANDFFLTSHTQWAGSGTPVAARVRRLDDNTLRFIITNLGTVSTSSGDLETRVCVFRGVL